MRFSSLLSASALLATINAQTYPLSQVYQFENSFSGVGYVNIENLALRKSNGQLLLNTVTGAIQAQLDPQSGSAELIVNLTNALGNGQPGSLTGIAESYPDVFTVAAGNFQFGPQVPGGVAGIPGSFSVWSIDLTGHEAKASLITTIPEAGSLNGVTTIQNGNKDYVLIADSINGLIYRVNVKTGEYKSTIASPLWFPTPVVNFGINGVHVQEGYLFWTNSAQATFGAVPIDLQTAEAIGPVTVFANAPNGTAFDDFSFKPSTGDIFLATQPNAISQIPREGQPIIVAGGGDDMTLAGPTSTAFGADGCTLYITTAGVGGGPNGPVSGGVFALDTCAPAKRMTKKWVA